MTGEQAIKIVGKLREVLTAVGIGQSIKVGDFVRMAKNCDKARQGMVGKVLSTTRGNNPETGQPYKYQIGVEFPELTNGHDLRGLAIAGHGQWVKEARLEKI